jgi:hypothetical protein
MLFQLSRYSCSGFNVFGKYSKPGALCVLFVIIGSNKGGVSETERNELPPVLFAKLTTAGFGRWGEHKVLDRFHFSFSNSSTVKPMIEK